MRSEAQRGKDSCSRWLSRDAVKLQTYRPVQIHAAVLQSLEDSGHLMLPIILNLGPGTVVNRSHGPGITTNTMNGNKHSKHQQSFFDWNVLEVSVLPNTHAYTCT